MPQEAQWRTPALALLQLPPGLPVGPPAAAPPGQQGAPTRLLSQYGLATRLLGSNWSAACRGRPTVDWHWSPNRPLMQLHLLAKALALRILQGVGSTEGPGPVRAPGRADHTPNGSGRGEEGSRLAVDTSDPGAGVAADSTVEGTASQPVVAPPVLWTLHPYVGAQSTRTPQSRVPEVLVDGQAAPEPPPPGSLPIQRGPPAPPDARPQSSGMHSRTGARDTSGPALGTGSHVASRPRREHRRGFGLCCWARLLPDGQGSSGWRLHLTWPRTGTQTPDLSDTWGSAGLGPLQLAELAGHL